MPIPVLVYVTKEKPFVRYDGFVYSKTFRKYVTSKDRCLPEEDGDERPLNGLIVASFEVGEAELYDMEYQNDGTDDAMKEIRRISTEDGEEDKERVASNEDDDEGVFDKRNDAEVLRESCLTFEGLGKMLFKKGKCGRKRFFSLKIENLKILEEPIGLADVYSDERCQEKLGKAPQSRMTAYRIVPDEGVSSDGTPSYRREAVLLLPIRAVPACQILNGEKTREIRTWLPKGLYAV